MFKKLVKAIAAIQNENDRDDRYDGMGCSGQFFTTHVRLFRRRGCWYAYHFVSVDM